MNINLESYNIFYEVSKNGSITATSNILHISQPAITYQIKKLETNLGISLFTRTKKGVVLTNEGKILYDFVEKAIESIRNGENTLQNLKNLDSGTLRIGASTTVCKYVLMPYLEIFHEKYPGVDIQIVNNLTVDLVKELRNGSIDILFLNMPMNLDKDLKQVKIMDVHDIFVGNKKYYDLTKGLINLKDLKKYPTIFQSLPSNTRTYLNNYLKNNNMTLLPKLEVVSYNLIMNMVSSGFGIGYATKEFIKKELNDKTLYEIKVIPEIPSRYIAAILLNNKIPNFSVNKLITMMK